MDRFTYLDFDLTIERSGPMYRVEVNSPAGQAIQTFTIPFSDLEIENALLRFGRPQRGTRRLESPEAAAARAFGARLFIAVFEGEVRSCLRSSIEDAQRQACRSAHSPAPDGYSRTHRSAVGVHV